MDEKERALGAHIRKLLLRYSLTHLTINYVTYTRTQVSELLSDCLHVVPLDEPMSLVLPIEPYEELSLKLGLKYQSAYDEMWSIDIETRQYITDTLGKVDGRDPPTKRCMDETSYTNSYGRLTSVLTTRAIRQTPRLGGLSSEPIGSSKRWNLQYLEHVGIKTVADETLEAVVFSQRERDQLLNIRPTLEKEMLGAVTSLIASVQDAEPHHNFPDDRLPAMVSSFLHNGLDRPPINSLCPMSPPIFPRPLETASVRGMENLSDIRSLGFAVPVKADCEELESPSKAHMLLVDGWHVLPPPPNSQSTSSDTPSLNAGSESSEVDELFALTPPNQPPRGSTSEDKIEEYLIPRGHKPGQGGKDRHGESKQRLATFLPPLLPPASVAFEPKVSDIPIHQSPPASLSILGQPTSPAKSSTTNNSTVQRCFGPTDASSFDTGLNALVTQLCAPVDGQRAEDYIMHERIDEDEALMMIVPHLREPFLHPSSPSCPILPTSARSLVSIKSNTLQSSTKLEAEPASVTVKKVAGVPSVNIELSWRPFNFGTSIPSMEELADVEHQPHQNSQSDLFPNHEDEEIELKKLLNTLEEHGMSSDASFRGQVCDEPAIDWTSGWNEDWSRYDVVLTRADRERVSRQQLSCPYDTEAITAESEAFDDPTRLCKRRKLEDSNPGADLLRDSEIQQDTETMQDTDCGRFSFNELCSPDLHSQDALFWNHGGDVPDSETLPVRGMDFLDHHLDPIWTAEGAARAASLTDEHVSAGSFVENWTDLSPAAQDLSTKSAPMEPMKSSRVATAPPTLLVPPEPLTSLSNITLSEKAFARESLSRFMGMRGIAALEAGSPFSSQPQPEPEPEPELPVDIASSLPRDVPTELMDANTLSLPDNWIPSPSRHRYIASMDVIQKTILLRHLTLLDCNVELVERETSAMKGVDLIVDVETALLFFPLALLPVSNKNLTERVARLSWDFTHLVIIFEAFSTSLSYHRDRADSDTALRPYAFPPAVMKALRTFKRTLAIMDGMVTGNKSRDVEVRYAYARDVGEAAKFARLVGDMAESSSTELGVDREWLTDDFHEDEMDLAQVKGMNAYAAAMILCHVDFNTLIDMEPADRIEMFSEMVGARRISVLNGEIANRLTHAAISSPQPLTSSAQSTMLHSRPVPESFGDTLCDDIGAVEFSGEYGYQCVEQDAVEW